MNRNKAKITVHLLLALIALLLQVKTGNAQFFDFEIYDGSEARNTLPNSLLGNKNITLKTLDFSGDTLWAGSYKDGFIKWWRNTPVQTVWYTINTLEGNEVYNLKAQGSTRVFFTDYNSFTNEYFGFFKLENQTILDAPLISQIEYTSPDSTAASRVYQVNDIEIVGDSLVLLATDSGLVMFDGIGKWRRRNPKTVGAIEDWKIEQTCANAKGELYLSSGSNIYRQYKSKWEKIDLSVKPYRLRDTYIKQMVNGPNDTIWAITTLGVAKIHSDTVIIWRNDEIKERLNEVKDIVFDNDNNPWIIFELNGGIQFQSEIEGKKQWLRINSTNSDLPDELSCIAKDSSGNMWFGSDSEGLFKYLSYTPGSINTSWPNQLSLFPSIAENGQFIFKNNFGPIELRIINLQGQTIKSQSIQVNDQLNFSLPSGAYIVQIAGKNLRVSKKIISVGY